MKMIKIMLIAFLAVSAPQTALPALELNSVKAHDIPALAAGLSVPAASPLDAALAPESALDPVVITLAGLEFEEIGGPLEVRHFLKLLKIFFPKRNFRENELAAAFADFNREYFFLEDEDDALALAAASDQKLPDNYVEASVRDVPGYAQHNVTVVPFLWSRDPDDSEEVTPVLAGKIIEVYDAYKASGRPIYILAHSWGSVLSHSALHAVARVRPDVRISKFITVGSPLMPANFVVNLFLKIEVKKEDLERAVSKPSIVKTWNNLWASRDAFSNAIASADTNYQADAEVEKVEPELINLILHNKPLKKDAKKDLFKVRNIEDWHSSYFYDYKATLKSLQKEISAVVFKPHLAPEILPGE